MRQTYYTRIPPRTSSEAEALQLGQRLATNNRRNGPLSHNARRALHRFAALNNPVSPAITPAEQRISQLETVAKEHAQPADSVQIDEAPERAKFQPAQPDSEEPVELLR